MGNLTISISPHLKGRNSTAKIMLDVIIAMLPAFIAGVYFFGLRALTVTAVTVAAAVLSEFLFQKLCKRDITVGDLSAVVTGIILAMNFPVSIPYWQAALGSVIAIVVVKQLFGGIGFNFANPASTARIVLLSSFGSTLSHWVAPKDISFTTMNMADLTTSATPMANIPVADATVPSLSDMLIGNIGGSIGETCSIAIIIGLVYLIARRVITPHIPLVIIGTVFVLGLFLAPEVISSSINVTGIKNVDYAIYNVISGGLLFGAVFMATDYVTSPVTGWGKVIFGIGCGFITFMIRRFGNLPEGISYGILLMNILTPYIDRVTATKPFGGVKK